MKSLFLFLLAALLATAPAVAQSKAPHPKRKAAFTHTSESGAAKGKANHAHFRRDNHPVTLNLHPHDPERFAKARSNKEYKYLKPGQLAKPGKFKN